MVYFFHDRSVEFVILNKSSVFFTKSRAKNPFSYCDMWIPGWEGSPTWHLLRNPSSVKLMGWDLCSHIFSLVLAHYRCCLKCSICFLAESREKEICLYMGQSNQEGEDYPEKLHRMVAEIVWPRSPCGGIAGGTWANRRWGHLATGDPFLQGVLSQRMCYSLWTTQDLLHLWLHVGGNVMYRRNKGVWG